VIKYFEWLDFRKFIFRVGDALNDVDIASTMQTWLIGSFSFNLHETEMEKERKKLEDFVYAFKHVKGN
jgi:hypothetical protein